MTKIVFLYCILQSSFFAAFSQDLEKALKYFNSDQYEKAALEFENALPAIEKEYGSTDTINFSKVLIFTGTAYERSQQFAKAEIYYLKAKTIYEEHNAINCYWYSFILNNLAVLYKSLGNYKEAEQIFLQALQIKKKILGVEHLDYAISLNNLAELYRSMGKYEKAEPLFKQSSQVIKNALGEEHPDYATTLNNQASLYTNMGKYEKAELLYIQVLQIVKKVYGEEHPVYATSLNNIAALYESMGYYKKAELNFMQAMQIRKKVLGEDHLDYANSLNNLAALYESMGDYEKAESFNLQALQIIKKVFGEVHPDYATALDNLATLYESMENYNKAELLYLQVIQIRKQTLGEEHPDYATSLNNLADLYGVMGKYEKAESLCLQSSQITKKTLGDEHPDYACSLNNLAVLYQSMGNYEKAERIFLQVLKIDKKVLADNHPNYATDLNNLAELYRATSKYEEAEPLYLQSLYIKKIVYGEQHPTYATTLNNLALLYTDMGKFEKAESLYIQTLQIQKKALGEESYCYATSLRNFAALCESMGKLERSEFLYLQSYQIIKETLGEENPGYAITLNCLAVLYASMGKFEKAEPLYLQALQIRKNTLGEEHSEYANSLNNLAVLYESMGKYEKAEPLLLQAMQIRKKVLGEENSDYAESLNNIANLYESLGKYEKAESLYLQALQIREKALGEKNPNYAIFLNNLAILYELMGHYDKAEPLYLKAIENINYQIKAAFTFMAEKEKESFYRTLSSNFNVYHSFFLKYKNIKPEVTVWSYNIELAQKGIILKSGSELRSVIINSGDNELLNKFDTLTTIKAELAFLYSQPKDKQYKNPVIVEEKAELIEKELAKNSQIFREVRAADTLKWLDIQNNLDIDEAAIEFVSFHYYDEKKWTDSTYYCALVIRTGYAQPEMIYLFEQKQIDSIFRQLNSNDFNKVNQLYSARGTDPEGMIVSGNFSAELYELILKPIEPFLKGANTIYYSPSGSLHIISFSAIAATDSLCLSDKYKLLQLGSTREIVKLKKQKDYITLSDSALVFGGINYDRMNTTHDSLVSNEILAYNRGPQISMDSSRGTTWRYLEGTMKEAKYIDSLFRKNKVATALYSDSNSTETLFKNISGHAPQIIHISTHGFFFPEFAEKRDQKALTAFGEQTSRFSENSLLRSGLILAGANYVWKGGESTPGKDDGILTAYEVSNMDLTNTKLVVLSACETGLGDIKGSEGVFGLQRAFKMAGVEYIIMSLWQVPDKETVEFMQLFYTNCFKKQTIREAFNNAQTEMRKKYDPYYWSAFVLME